MIDSNALIHRAYHAYPSSLTTSKGQQINAIFGFFAIILQVLFKYKPTEVFFAFDSKKKTFRHELYPEYKATRKKTDEELINQFKVLKDILIKINFNVIEKDGYEADDIIGTLSRDKKLSGVEKIIITGDRDLLQLINEEVRVFLSGSTFQKSSLYDSKMVQEKLGLSVGQIVEYKALRGDVSDNIPGIKGIGEVSAKKLLTQYKSVDHIFEHLEDIDSRIRSKLENNKEIAYLSRKLATINTKAELDRELGNTNPSDLDYENLYKIFQEFSFRSLVTKLKTLQSLYTYNSSLNFTQNEQLGFVDNVGTDNAVKFY